MSNFNPPLTGNVINSPSWDLNFNRQEVTCCLHVHWTPDCLNCQYTRFLIYYRVKDVQITNGIVLQYSVHHATRQQLINTTRFDHQTYAITDVDSHADELHPQLVIDDFGFRWCDLCLHIHFPRGTCIHLIQIKLSCDEYIYYVMFTTSHIVANSIKLFEWGQAIASKRSVWKKPTF